MELNIALRNLVSLQGSSILVNQSLVNYLSDFQGFETLPAAKFVVKTMLTEGYLEKIKSSYEQKLLCNNDIVLFYNELRNIYAFRDEVVSYVLNQIESALNWEITVFPVNSYNNLINNDEYNHDDAIVIDAHCKFKNIPICGSLDNIESKLNSKGYTTLEKSSDGIFLSGSFAGIDDCNLLVNASPYINGEVYSISVLLPERQNWFSVKADYDTYKQKLTSKYGVPYQNNEFFLEPYFEGDGYELSAIENGKAFFMSKFNVENGNVSIFIAASRLYISYTDFENERRIDAKRESVAQDEL